MNGCLDNTDLSDKEKKAILELKHRLMKLPTVEHVILFGSAVRKERRSDSDIDILVLTNEPVAFKDFSKMMDITVDVSYEYDGIIINIVPFYKEDWERGVTSVTPFRKNVANEGVYL